MRAVVGERVPGQRAVPLLLAAHLASDRCRAAVRDALPQLQPPRLSAGQVRRMFSSKRLIGRASINTRTIEPHSHWFAMAAVTQAYACPHTYTGLDDILQTVTI